MIKVSTVAKLTRMIGFTWTGNAVGGFVSSDALPVIRCKAVGLAGVKFTHIFEG